MTEKSHPGLIGSDLARYFDGELQKIEDDPMTPLIREHRAYLARRGRDVEPIVFETSYARVFIYAGEFVAECPRRGCGNVEYVTEKRPEDRAGSPTLLVLTWGERKTTFYCSYCRLVTDEIRWPDDADELMKVLNRRPIPHNRNWFPAGHLIAVKSGTPHGQTLADLIDENHEHGVY